MNKKRVKFSFKKSVICCLKFSSLRGLQVFNAWLNLSSTSRPVSIPCSKLHTHSLSLSRTLFLSLFHSHTNNRLFPSNPQHLTCKEEKRKTNEIWCIKTKFVSGIIFLKFRLTWKYFFDREKEGKCLGKWRIIVLLFKLFPIHYLLMKVQNNKKILPTLFLKIFKMIMN